MIIDGPAPSLSIMVRKLKLGGTWSEHPATLVQAGPEGWWLYSAAGTKITNSDGRTGRQPADGLQLVSFERWFRAWWFVPGEPPLSRLWERPWIAVDIAEPARIDHNSGRIDVVDLELDLWCSDEGYGLVDEDELADAERLGLLSAATAERARQAADEVAAELRVGYPAAFGGTGWRLLDQARAPISGGPGWQLDPLTLRPEIIDRSLFRSGLADDPCRPVIEALWTGRPAEARAYLDEMLIMDPDDPRLRSLAAECDRDLGRIGAALEVLSRLAGEHPGEPALAYRLGATRFATSDYAGAHRAFALAASRSTSGGEFGAVSAPARDRARQLAGA
ncbi:tetratricopeptide repeat protein [Microlunatus parietis]|uniref:DUF402 domain-containing protein n=1 Tax=Microlunatus parietis TaxID=682979 RepID=A0A7Y9LBN1_9ACTN|nr:tetratricopeptide repeat protein [Microlunatus parietis]NYE71023.1 hypothetical protein [Microlunatus parietis]